MTQNDSDATIIHSVTNHCISPNKSTQATQWKSARPENAALISNFARYANGIVGSEPFMDPEMTAAPEIVMPADAPAPEFVPPCDQEVVELYNKVWTNLKK